jgi:D-alanine-D-alanine ligase
MASALAMDKWRTKLVWDASGIPTPRFAMVKAGTNWERVVETLGMPIIMKPAREGSTIGLTKVSNPRDFGAAYALASRYDNLVVAEEFIAGEELTASILGDTALPLVRIEAPQGNYDYQNKYFTDDTKYFCPSGLPDKDERSIRDLVLRSAQALGCAGWGRADLIRRADGSVTVLEMNTSPGMTGHSLVPMAAKAAGIPFDELVVRILEAAHVG